MSSKFADKSIQFNFGREMNRRAVLRGAGVSMALPWLSAMNRSIASEKAAPQRFVAVTLGLDPLLHQGLGFGGV